MACKKAPISQEVEAPIWNRVDFKPSKETVLPTAYQTYTLQTDLFEETLKLGQVVLPGVNGLLNAYTINNSAVMSPELQAKFPNIRSYEGVNLNNKLCKCRIDQKNNTFTIAIFCNDATYFIKELSTEGIYFFYAKHDLPEGIGHIKE